MSEQPPGQSSNHQLRKIHEQQEKQRAKEEAKKKSKEDGNGSKDTFGLTTGPISPKKLQQVVEDEESENLNLPVCFIRAAKNDKNTIELISPDESTIIKVRNTKIPLASDYFRF